MGQLTGASVTVTLASRRLSRVEWRGKGTARATETLMAFEAVKAEIGILLTKMQNEPEDRHELYLQLMEKLNELKAYGMPIPDDLLELEKALEAEFAEDKREQET
jgi:hypothetical protein